MKTPVDIQALILQEGWEIKQTDAGPRVIADGYDCAYRHPAVTYLKLYRLEKNPESKYLYMKKAHDYLWPDRLWHYWTERRFRKHCEGWNYMTYAGCADSAKSTDAALIAGLFWLANPKKRGVVIASTTLKSLESRIWGYAMRFLSTMKVKLPFQYLGGGSPRVLYPADRSQKEIRDTIHGMFAVAAQSGGENDDAAIRNWIGRHPDDALMLILDECTDLPTAILGAFANLDTITKPFQVLGIGNSASKHDVHGALSTPKDPKGWASVNPKTDIMWETTQRNGICLYFSAYESPALFEKDPERKKKLGVFLPNEEKIAVKEKSLGKDSDAFYRFVLGFWKEGSGEDIVMSKQFLDQFSVTRNSEWIGLHPLHVVGGLDPAFSTGGDQCILRLAILGVDVDGKVVLDYRGEELTFEIPILRSKDESAEIQIANHVLKILDFHRCPLHHVAIDATGQGRAIGSVIFLKAKALKPPIKIYSTRHGIHQQKSFDVIPINTYDLWNAFRDFMQHEQIKGLDHTTIIQLTSRRVELKNGKMMMESKDEYKKRMGAILPSLAHSPDRADAAALALQAAILNFGFHPGQKREMPKLESGQNEKMWTWNQERMMNEIQTHKEAIRIKMDFSGSLSPLKLPL